MRLSKPLAGAAIAAGALIGGGAAVAGSETLNNIPGSQSLKEIIDEEYVQLGIDPNETTCDTTIERSLLGEHFEIVCPGEAGQPVAVSSETIYKSEDSYTNKVAQGTIIFVGAAVGAVIASTVVDRKRKTS